MGRISRIMLAVILVLMTVLGCKKIDRSFESDAVVSPFASFKDIPGVTDEEIAAIEALRKQYSHFVYGTDYTTEAFPVGSGEDGNIGEYAIGGYTALICEWLTGLFDIPFIPKLYLDNWDDLIADYNSGGVHFMGSLTATEERKKTHYMTTAIAERPLKTFHIAGTPSISEIIRSRPPRIAFTYGFEPYNYAMEIAEYSFEPVFIDNINNVYNFLTEGEADVFVTMEALEPTVYRFGNFVSETFYPLVFAAVSLSTRKADLELVISLVQKALENGGRSYLVELYSKGRRDYIKNELFEHLTPTELEYIQRHPIVKVATESDHYPISFYNSNENELQGITFDIMKEVEAITGLSFIVANVPNTNYLDLIGMVESGEASMITQVMRSREREGRFLLPETPVMRESSVLISKSEFSNVHLNEIANVAVGIVRGTMQAELFRRWFPNNVSFREYDNMDSVFNALQRGEVEMLMSATDYLLSIENYKELAGYKVNFAFDNHFDITFGFNKNEATLCSIVDKALALIDLETISGYWTLKRYDYRAKVAEAQLPWLVGAILLSLVTLALILVLLYRTRNERKLLAKLVSEKTSTLTAILDATPDLIFFKDSDLRHTECNKSLEKHLNIRKSDIVGKNDAEAFNFPAELNEHYAAKDRKVIAEKQISIVEETIPSADGKERLFETIKSPIIQNGEATGLVGISRDITRRKAAEEEAKKASAEAKNASEAKSQFLASMSHEIRTPMNAILGVTEILLQNDLLPDTKEALNIIYNSGYSLLGIINDLLDLSKIEAGKLDLINDRYEMASLINDTINLNISRIGSKPIEFKLNVDEDIPLELVGDELRIKQILNNLLSNAFKYTDSGEVSLSFAAEICSDNNTPYVMLTITVCDTGQGMTDEQVQNLFDVYSRFNLRVNRFVEGTGLGMNIVQHLVQKMDGEIAVDSVPNKGTKVVVHLTQGYTVPARLGKDLADSLMSFRLTGVYKTKKAQITREYMPYGRVLVVDDMETNLYVARGFMLPYGLSIDTVLSGMEAIEKIEHGNEYDIVFMDHMMPVMDGIEATKAIRAKGYTRAIIALTANAVAGQAETLMENGFDGFISKPIDIRELNASLNKFVRDRQLPEVVEAARAAYSSSITANAMPQIDADLAKIFANDAEKAIAVLQSYGSFNSNEIDSLKMFIISIHALKSALANIGERKLSSFAHNLEQAGREQNIAFITDKTPVFLSELQTVVDKLRSGVQEYSTGNISDDDMAHLRKMLESIKEACTLYDIDATKAIFTELKQKQWPGEYGKLLDTIGEHLLHSDFDEVVAVCSAYLSDGKKIGNEE